MKTIVCYGDSNTWGCSPIDTSRIPYSLRWTGILQTLLGDEYLVYEEGLNGRTTVFDDPVEPHRNGITYFEPCLLSKKPVDLLVIMLGTNDVKAHLHQTSFSISKGMEQLILAAKNPEFGKDGNCPQILIVSPIEIGKDVSKVWLGGFFREGSREMAQELHYLYRDMAELHGCHFMAASDYAQPSPVDQIHLDEANHSKLAHAFHKRITEIFD